MSEESQPHYVYKASLVSASRRSTCHTNSPLKKLINVLSRCAKQMNACHLLIMQMRFLLVSGHLRDPVNRDKAILIYLIKRMAPVERNKTIIIPRAIGTDGDEKGEEVTFLCCIDDDNKRDEQWMSRDKILGGGPTENIGGGGGNWEQCWHAEAIVIFTCIGLLKNQRSERNNQGKQ